MGRRFKSIPKRNPIGKSQIMCLIKIQIANDTFTPHVKFHKDMLNCFQNGEHKLLEEKEETLHVPQLVSGDIKGTTYM